MIMNRTIEERLGCKDETDFKPRFIGMDLNNKDLDDNQKKVYQANAELEKKLVNGEISWEVFKSIVKTEISYFFIF